MSAVRLSPATLAGIKAQHADLILPEEENQVEQVTLYRCLACKELHEDEDDAVDCCLTPLQRYKLSCPVCGNDGFWEPRLAADCCLWKDIPQPERWAIGDAVQAGKTWLEALGLQREVPL